MNIREIQKYIAAFILIFIISFSSFTYMFCIARSSTSWLVLMDASSSCKEHSKMPLNISTSIFQLHLGYNSRISLLSWDSLSPLQRCYIPFVWCISLKAHLFLQNNLAIVSVGSSNPLNASYILYSLVTLTLTLSCL